MWSLSNTLGLSGLCKENGKLALPLFVLLALCRISLSAQAKYGGGAGTENDPYLIRTAEQMNTIGTEPNDSDKHFKLMADIDLSGYTGSQFNIIGADRRTPFTGTFDGNGRQILNFTYTSTENDVGLFGIASGRAVIKNLGLVNPHVEGNSGVGALIGYTEQANIHNCYVKGGSVNGTSSVGGLIGTNSGSITCCYTWTVVSGESYVGGLAGNSLTRIVNSYSRSDVSGERIIGGLVGKYEGGILNCYACGPVRGQTDTGGLAAIGQGILGGLPYGAFFSFWDVQATGQASSADGEGNSEGKTTAQMKAANTFIPWSCEGLWTLDEGEDYPHLAWEQAPGQTISAELSDYLAGAGTESEPYHIYEAEEFNVIGLFPCEWDKHFKLMADIDMSSYEETALNIIGFVFCYLPYYYASYTVADEYAFTGMFDGNGNILDSFSCHAARDVELFDLVGRPAVIQNLTLVDPNVSSESGAAAILVRWLGSKATVRQCRVQNGTVTALNGSAAGLVLSSMGRVVDSSFTGQVQGHSPAGGLVCYSSGEIERCFSNAEVSGGDQVGGLVGMFHSALDGRFYIRNCYSCGHVTGKNQVGGLVGLHEGLTGISPAAPSMFNCYSTAVVTGVDKVGGLIGDQLHKAVRDEDSLYWDIEASTQPASIGGIGKTTAEMKQRATFVNWDFIEVWGIADNQTYPFLRTHPAGDLNYDYSVNMLDLAIVADRWLEKP